MTDITDRFWLPHILPGQAQKEVWHNEALALVDALLHPVAESRDLNVPPASPQPGQCWITGTAPSGDWSGEADRFAICTTAGWRFATPVEDMRIWVRDESIYIRRTTSGWEDGVVAASSITVGGAQVLSGQEPAISDVSGGSVTDAEARTAIAGILSALRNHGIIAT